MSDTELLDVLERFIDNHGGLLIHHYGSDSRKYAGLGLRCTNRTLRQALYQAMGRAPETGAVSKDKTSPEAKA